MQTNSEQRPSELLLESLDFRVNSLQQLVAGELMPLQRRLQVFQSRRAALAEIGIPDQARSTAPEQEVEQKSGETEGNDSDEEEEEEEEESDDDSRDSDYHEARQPRMSVAARGKRTSENEE